MNALIYLNLSDTTYANDPADTLSKDVELSEWKSVSLVTNNCAIVLSCNDSSNKLLKPLVGKQYAKNQQDDTERTCGAGSAYCRSLIMALDSDWNRK